MRAVEQYDLRQANLLIRFRVRNKISIQKQDSISVPVYKRIKTDGINHQSM